MGKEENPENSTAKDEGVPLMESSNNNTPEKKADVRKPSQSSAQSKRQRWAFGSSSSDDSHSVEMRGKSPDYMDAKRRSKSIRMSFDQSGSRRSSIIYNRGMSVESPGGRKLVKNLSRVDSIDTYSPTSQERFPLFRLNSIVGSIPVAEEGEEPERQTWDNQIEFLLSCISMSVGLGNVWRFPFTAYENGGGAFLIPYIMVLLFIGRPLYLLELALGQFSSSGSVRVWDMVPAFGGVGYGQVVATGNHVIFITFSLPIPLGRCDVTRLVEMKPECVGQQSQLSATR